MIFIDKNRPSVLAAKQEHWQFMKCRLAKKIVGQKQASKKYGTCVGGKKHTYNSTPAIEKKIIDFLITQGNLEKIIIGEPNTLLGTVKHFFNYTLPQRERQKIDSYLKETKKARGKDPNYNTLHSLFKDIAALFNYNWFIGLSLKSPYSAYHMTENLGMRACTYCNRTYTTTARSTQNGKLMRPQLDHWYPKSYFPLLALSFFNLIPSCYTCNSSVKGDTILKLKYHIHPYIDSSQSNEFTFGYEFDQKLNSYSIYVKSNSGDDKAYNTLKELKVDQMYNAHISELEDLIKIKKAYSSAYIEKIKSLFPASQTLSENEIYRFLFGTELEVDDFHKRPLSKFKSDILKELKIIKK